MKNKKIKCDIYTRVSTTMQVDGYSLDAQKEKLKRYAEFQNMEIVNEYSDEGKSGKSVEGRPEFQRMLDNIENGTDEVQFVLVFKLSRFGRNAADVLNSLQRMQDFGVNLICVEDGIDSSKDSGKLMISVLSAVAEIERENILVQTMEGRKQKAREGKWNGGFAPYGYELVNGELQIAEDEAEIIRLIYDKFIHTNMGISAIAAWLNQHGYKKKKRQNNTLDAFAASFIKGVLDNPVYCGKLAYGRRKNEKVSGTRNEYRIVKQENYMLHDGIHEGIISETDWELAHQKREKTGVKYEKMHSPLAGECQRENLATTLEVIRCLNRLGYRITEAQVREGLSKTRWTGRFTCLSESPLFFVDGAHNEDAALKLKVTVERYFSDYKKIFIMGVFKDKEYEKITSILCPLAESIYTVSLPNKERTLPAEKLAEVVKKHCQKVKAEQTIETAVEDASKEAMTQGKDIAQKTVILACGSLSYLGEVQRIVLNNRQ